MSLSQDSVLALLITMSIRLSRLGLFLIFLLLFPVKNKSRKIICLKFRSNRWNTVTFWPELINSLTTDFSLSGFFPSRRKSSMVLWFEPDYLWPTSTKVSLSISFLHSWTDLIKHKFKYLFLTFVQMPENSFGVLFLGFTNFYCPVEFYAPKCGHIPRVNQRLTLKFYLRLIIIPFLWKDKKKIWEVHWSLKWLKKKQGRHG